MAGCALGLAGCNLAPVYHAPVAKVPTAYKEAGDWRPAAPADAMPRSHWWMSYGDRTLDDLEAQVESGSPTLAAAAAHYEQARSVVAQLRSALYPSVGFGGTVLAEKQSANTPFPAAEPAYFGANTVDAQASYEIDFWGRIRDRVQAGREQAQASAADLATVRLTLHAELADEYAGLRGMDQQARLLADTVAAYTQAYQLTHDMFEDKIASLMDVTRAQTQLHDAQAQLSDVTARRALLEHAIADLVGLPPAALTIAPAAAQIAVPAVPPGLPSALLQRRPDIAAAERRVAAANEMIGVARAAFFPDISLGAQAGFESADFQLVNLPDDFWAIGPGVVLPLFEGGLRRAKVREARAVFDESADEYRATVLHAFQEVEDDLALLHWLKNEQQQQAQAAAAAQQTLDLSMGLYRNGASGYLDVVTAQTSALAAERAVLALQTRRLQASIGLIRALAGGWSEAVAAHPAAAHLPAVHPVATWTGPMHTPAAQPPSAEP